MLQRVCILPHQRWPLPHLSGSASTVSAGLSDAGVATRPWGVPYTATSYSTRHQVRCCCRGCEIRGMRQRRARLIHWQLNYWCRMKDDGFLMRTTRVWRNEDDYICEIYPRLIAGGFEADRCRCSQSSNMYSSCVFEKAKKTVKIKKDERNAAKSLTWQKSNSNLTIKYFKNNKAELVFNFQKNKIR